MKLTYKRQQWSGTYYAHTDTHTFALDKLSNALWDVRIWTRDPSKLVSCDSARTMHDAKVLVQKFVADQGA